MGAGVELKKDEGEKRDTVVVSISQASSAGPSTTQPRLLPLMEDSSRNSKYSHHPFINKLEHRWGGEVTLNMRISFSFLFPGGKERNHRYEDIQKHWPEILKKTSTVCF